MRSYEEVEQRSDPAYHVQYLVESLVAHGTKSVLSVRSTSQMFGEFV